MLLAKTLRSTTFRLALIFIAIFGAVVLVLFSYIYATTESYVMRASDRAIAADRGALQRIFETSGRSGLTAAIKEFSSVQEGDRYYLLVDAGFSPLAGNLKSWPLTAGQTPNPGDLKSQDANGADRRLRASVTTLPDGSHMLIGRSIEDDAAYMRRVRWAFVAVLVLIAVLAAVASVTVTRRTVGRIETINATSKMIMEAGLDRRIPLRGTRDEWDKLAANLNSMLDRIETLMREMKEVTDNVAHDLRTPLTRIYGRLERACNRPRQAEEDQALIGDIMGDLDDVLRMFSSLMRISQIETRNRLAAFRLVNLAEIAREVTELFDAAAEDRQARLCVVAEPKVLIVGDRDLLFDALANLVDNAIKHGREAGKVTVAVSENEDTATVIVADDGPGIPPEEFAKVFKRFYRLERSRCTRGNGLGLSLVAAIARLHGARVDLADNSPGACLRLSFPKRPGSLSV